MNKEKIKIQEETQEEIPFFESMLKKPEYIMAWLSGLTDTEQKVVSILFKTNQATTIKNIRLILIINTIYANSPKKYVRNIFEFPFNNFYYLPLEYDKQKLFDFEMLNKNRRKEIIEEIQKTIKFPSYERIDSTIQDLVRLKIVMERKSGELENQKIKGLYFLNPVIRTHLQAIKEKKYGK